MLAGFFAAFVGSALTSAAVIDSITAGTGLGISIYVASRGLKQGNSSRKRRRSM